MTRKPRHRFEPPVNVHITEDMLNQYRACASLLAEAREIVDADGIGSVEGVARRLIHERYGKEPYRPPPWDGTVILDGVDDTDDMRWAVGLHLRHADITNTTEREILADARTTLEGMRG